MSCQAKANLPCSFHGIFLGQGSKVKVAACPVGWKTLLDGSSGGSGSATAGLGTALQFPLPAYRGRAPE